MSIARLVITVESVPGGDDAARRITLEESTRGHVKLPQEWTIHHADRTPRSIRNELTMAFVELMDKI